MSTASTTHAAGSPVIDPELPAPLSMGAVLRITAMRRLWYAQIISVFGDVLALFAVIGTLTFQLGANPQQVTGVQISYLLPIALLGVIAGVFIDRWPLKATMITSDLLRAGLVLLLLPAAHLWHFYAVLASISVVSSFFGPAQGVAIRSMVPLHGLRSANALIQQVMFGMRIVGPFVAALLVAWFGYFSCYVVDGASFVGSALLIASVAFAPSAAPAAVDPALSPAASTGLARVWVDTRQGIDFIFHHAGLLFVILALAAGMFVLGCFGPLIAIYVRETLGASTKTFGIASALIGVGMLVGVNALGIFAKKVRGDGLVFAGLAGIAAGVGLLAGVPQVWATFLGDGIIGFAVAGIVVPSQTMIQQETPPALMGRVGATTMSIIFTAQLSGLVLSGILAEHLGVRRVFMLCAVMLLVLIVVGYVWRKPWVARTGGLPLIP